jgi:acyl-CoA thioester hydrolase
MARLRKMHCLGTPMSDSEAPQAPSTGHIEGKAHILPVRVYYEETDFTGVVYHANYLKFFERGRTDFLRMIGVRHLDLWSRDEPLAFTIRGVALEFIRPAKIDDALEVHTKYTQLRGPSIHAMQTLKRGEETLVTAKVHAVLINADGKPRRAPLTIREALDAYIS